MKRTLKWFEIWAVAVPLLVVGLPLLYLLAMGPVVFMYEKGWISRKNAQWYAAPYESVDHQAWFIEAGMGRALEVYNRWWWELAR
jgi:hypothetical protein